jgi:signal transduction histidine kinase
MSETVELASAALADSPPEALVQNPTDSDDPTWSLYTGANWSVAASSLLRAIIHEMRNPLQAVILGAGGLVAAAKLPEHRLTGAIERETSRLNNLLTDLQLVVQRSERPLGAVPVEALLREVGQLDSHFKWDVDVSVSVALRVGVSAVYGSAERLRHVLINLLVNAQEAVAAVGGGQVRLSATAEQGQVVIAVEDDGPGIPERDREWVFEPFATTKGPGQGRGLGLTVARHIVTTHGGTLVAEPSLTGVGARLVARLPRLKS